MSYQIHAYIEINTGKGWQMYAGPPCFADQADGNLAPASWGGRNFAVYYGHSGERGLPPDLSPGVRQLIDQQQLTWGDDVINRPSWMTLAEIQQFSDQDRHQELAHFDLQFLQGLVNDHALRVVFWAI